MKRVALAILYLSIPFMSFSQLNDGHQIIYDIVEKFLLEEGDEFMVEELTEALFHLLENPIDINNATEDDLKELFFLSDSQIQSLLGHIKNKGKLLTIYELQLVDNFDENTVRTISPFISVTTVQSVYRRNPKHSVLLRLDRTLEDKKGFISQSLPNTESYIGSPVKKLVKLKSYQTNRYKIALVMENDAGEIFNWDSKKKYYGTDFLSAHLALEHKGIIKTILIGDYQMNVGQGLTLSHSFSLGKSAETVNSIRKNHQGLKPYNGSNEYNFFRGLAATISYNNFTITPFFSKKLLDARLNADNERIYASSINGTGMHRTNKELAIRQNLTEINYGFDLQFRSVDRRLEAGFTSIKTELEYPLIPNTSNYNQFAFSGNELLNLGTRFRYSFRNMYLFSELSSSNVEDYAGLIGLQAHITPSTSLAMLYRNYGKNHHSFYSQAFGESSNSSNEEGIYWGINVHLHQKLKLNLYYDLFKFPWLKYQSYTVNSQGFEFLSRITYTPTKQSSIYCQYRLESKEKNDEIFTGIQYPIAVKKNRYLVNFDLHPTKTIHLKFRVQGTFYDNYQGIALSQDANFIFSRVKLYNRFALFDAEQYETRQYMYEKDVLYAFSIPALYGQGMRYYSMVEYKILKNLSFWARIARTNYRDRERIGSGMEEISGNKKTDFKIQVRYTL